MEQILVVPRDLLLAGKSLQGFSSDPSTLSYFLDQVMAHGRFVPRGPAERDESLKQIVPYGIVQCQGRVFLFRRQPKGAEAGLRGRWSIGLGGHVNPGDGREIGLEMLRQALIRELAEEVDLDSPRPKEWGVLNDDTDPVGRRHFGFIYHVWVATPVSESREPGKIQGKFVPLEAAPVRYEAMETWSRVVVDAFGL